MRWVAGVGFLVLGLACEPAVSPLPQALPAVSASVVQISPPRPSSAQRLRAGKSSRWSGPFAPPTTDVCDGVVPNVLTDCELVGKVKVTSVHIPSNCYADLVIRENEEGRVFRCRDLDALTFERATFHGPHHEGQLDVCTDTHYRDPTADACDWRSVQRVTGPPGRLTLKYGEAPESTGHCAPACEASATLERIP